MRRIGRVRILLVMAGGGLAALIIGLILGQVSSLFRLLVMVGIIGLTAGLAGLALVRLFASDWWPDGETLEGSASPDRQPGGQDPDDGAARRLDEMQRGSLVSELTGADGRVMIWAADRDRAYARDFAECFIAAGWKVKITYLVGGVGHDGFQVHRERAHPHAAQPIVAAMWVAGFAIDILDSGPGTRKLDGFNAGLSLGAAH